MIRNHKKRIGAQAIPVVIGVACAALAIIDLPAAGAAQSELAEETTLTTQAARSKPVPNYLVNSDSRLSTHVQELQREGNLTDAINYLESAANVSSSHAEQKLLVQEAFRIKALMREFSVPEAEMLRKIQTRIKDATTTDLQKWTEDRSLSWIRVDGRVRYFRREPGILLRLNPEAKTRAEAGAAADPAGETDEKFSFTSHMKAALDAARDTGSSVVLPVKFKVKHTVAVKPGKVPAGETIRCWMPFPREDVLQQSDVKMLSAKPEGRLSPDEASPHRTVYFEQVAAADGSARFELEFEYTCGAFVPDLTTAAPQLSAEELKLLLPYLEERPPHVEATKEITELATSIVGDSVTVTDKAYDIWSWVDKNIPWCPEMEYAVMPNIVDKVLTERRGDCGTQVLTFVSLCRAVNVPARWQSGWVMRPGHWNLHDWAEFYAPGIGWVPADPSVGSQKHDDPAVREFLFGHMDAYRMIANSDYAAEFNPPKNHHRSDPIDNQRGEVEWSGGNLYYDDWSYNVDVEHPESIK